MPDDLIEIANGVKVPKGTTVYDAGMKSVAARVVTASAYDYGWGPRVDCVGIRGVAGSGLHVARADAIVARIATKNASVVKVEKTLANLSGELKKLTSMLAAEQAKQP